MPSLAMWYAVRVLRAVERHLFLMSLHFQKLTIMMLVKKNTIIWRLKIRNMWFDEYFKAGKKLCKFRMTKYFIITWNTEFKMNTENLTSKLQSRKWQQFKQGITQYDFTIIWKIYTWMAIICKKYKYYKSHN